MDTKAKYKRSGWFLWIFFLIASCNPSQNVGHWTSASNDSLSSGSSSFVSHCEPIPEVAALSFKNSQKKDFLRARAKQPLNLALFFDQDSWTKAFVSGLFIQKAHSSMPAGGCGGYELQKGSALKLTWEKGAQPQVVGWEGSFSCQEVPSHAKSFSIERVWWGEEKDKPSKLIVVPRDNTLKPKILDIKEDQKKVHFSTNTISANKIWLWGRLPKSPCPGTCGVPLPQKLNLSFANGKSLSNVAGVFLVQLKKTSTPRYLFLEPDTTWTESYSVQAFAIDGFQAMPDSLLSTCIGTNTCSKDEKPLGPGPSSWGKALELKVKFKKDINPISCPV